jgi:hypothetical protein
MLDRQDEVGWGVRFLLAEDTDPLLELGTRGDIFGFESQVAGREPRGFRQRREGGDIFVYSMLGNTPRN